MNYFSQALTWLGAIDPAIRAPFAITLGAIPGALSRYYLTLWFSRWLGSGFPFGTFLINISGALVMGFFMTLLLERNISVPDLRLLVAVGFLGSYTTFSTYALDTANLLKVGQANLALVYWLGSATLGFLGLQSGCFLANRLFPASSTS